MQIVNRLHRLLTELIPGGAAQTGPVRRCRPGGCSPGCGRGTWPGPPAGGWPMDLVADLVAVDAKLKALKAELRIAVRRDGSTLMDLHGIGPAGAARLLVDVGDVDPVPDQEPLRVLERHRTPGRLLRGADPPPALPRREPADQPRPAHHGDRPAPPRHRRPGLLPAQARRRARPRWKPCAASNDACPTWSTGSSSPTQTGRPSAGASGQAGPGGHAGATTDSSADDLATPMAVSSDKSLPGPATPTLPPTPPQRTSVLRSVPDALPRRPAAAVKRPLLDGDEDRRTLHRRKHDPLDTEGNQRHRPCGPGAAGVFTCCPCA